MKKNVLTSLIILLSVYSYGQSKEEREILKEGDKLYRSEMASWYGTDIFLEKFSDRRQSLDGYLSYLVGSKAICIFFAKGDSTRIIGSFTFDSTYNVNTAIVDGQEREPTRQELDLITIRQKALTLYKSDTLFRIYQDMNPNFIPINDEKGKRVYVLTGPKKQGVVVFGNDYLITFDKNNNLKERKRLHKNIIPINYGEKDGKIIMTTMHSHLPETGDLITATDICTLKLYGKYARWGQHYVISKSNVSLWDCEKGSLLVLTRKAWDRIYKSNPEYAPR
jgi:hypothetical protein